MARGRRGLPPSGEGFSDIQPDPSRVGGVAEAPFVRLPDPARLFVERERRLAALAPDHPMGAYLAFLGGVVAAQAACVVALPPPVPVAADQMARWLEHGFPAIARDQVIGNEDFVATLSWMLDHVGLADAPAEARAAVYRLRAMSAAALCALAADMMEGAFTADMLAESLFVVAALQVHLVRLAAQLEAAKVMPAEAGVCPVCGGTPVSSVVVGWTQASKARYCVCGLCGTLWNHVRIKCTACGETQGIVYYTIEDGPKTIGIETCSACRSYIKHLQQHEDPRLEPLVDDVASYALDLMAREAGFRRSGPNPLLLTL
jgi:FdhE protein